MSKPDSVPVPEAIPNQGRRRQDHNRPQEPMSGSKQVKQENHSRHNNGEG
ncbi:MAG TPA: small acid-soluble spore protein P [Paenibacillus sp.]|nr:small acid-soluble spore protein P [Paenibacillus sp.]HUC94178.1 small acid-soluble spore protein P [Paenibacillus sp.]